jgi:ABC-type phosphate/phosphonate transport system ATPase subunit
MPEVPQIAVRSLEVAREKRSLVRNLDLAIPRGHFLVIAGPSGAGKTSLLSCLAGLIEPRHGEISYEGRHAPADYRARLGLVFQHLLLTPNATAETNALCGLLGGLPWWRTLGGFCRADKSRAQSILEKLQLAGYAQTPVRRISGGERQRVAIARALMASPQVILADEPVSHLDPPLARAVLALLRQQARETGCAVVCVLHDEALTAEFADSILSLRKDEPEAWSLKTR